MDALPIDISHVKLADWLVDRRRMRSDWRKKLAQLRARLASALLALPKHTDPWLVNLNPDSAGYLEAKQIRDIFLRTSPEERSVFGRVAGPGREWDAIVHAYEKDNLFLGEAAQMMVHNVSYEIPFHKKQVAKVQQQLADLERKEAELKRSATASASRYQHACHELGIAGVNIRNELLASVSSLPAIFASLKALLSAARVDEAIQLYHSYISYAHTGDGRQDDDSVTLAALKDVQNTPQEVGGDIFPSHGGNAPVADVVGEAGSQNAGDTVHKVEDADDNVQGVELLEAEGIQWDIDMAQTPVEFNKSEDSINEDHSGIVWDIDVEQSGDQEETSSGDKMTGAAVEKSGMFAPPCRLVDMAYRSGLLNDLHELKAFLVQRVHELKNTASAALQSQIQAVSSVALPHYGIEALNEMEGAISMALSLLTSSRTRELLLISTSERFLDRLEASLKETQQNETKAVSGLKDVAHRKVQLRTALSSSWLRQEAVVSKTRDLKRSVEDALSRLYGGRPVNIIGEINVVV